MRTTDPTDPQPFQPLGEKVSKPTLTPAQTWTPLSHNKDISVGADGKMKTTNHPKPS